MSRKQQHDYCDKCSQPIFGAGIVVLGVDDGRGLQLPAALQERTFCGADCFWQWTEENKPATVKDDFDEP